MSNISQALRAAGQPDRIGILGVLLEHARAGTYALSISQVAESCELGRFSASRHLEILSTAGLVDTWHDGRRRMHALRFEAFETIEDWVISFTADQMMEAHLD